MSSFPRALSVGAQHRRAVVCRSSNSDGRCRPSHRRRSEGEETMVAVRVGEASFEGQPAIILESDGARVVVLPRIGGKIASLVDTTTGEELLWRNRDRTYREPRYGDAWAAYDMSGWEDCLPTIAACPYP